MNLNQDITLTRKEDPKSYRPEHLLFRLFGTNLLSNYTESYFSRIAD
jgi:hypothetical protein